VGGRVARYGKAVAKPGHGEEVAELLLAAAGELESDPGCEQAALDAALETIRSSEGPKRVKELIDSFAMVELDLLGGKLPASLGR
jgi:hypothetical protein